MSETSILPGATPAPVADNTGVPVPPEFDNEPTGNDDRRRLMIIGGVVAAVIVAIAAYFLLHKSSSSDSSFPPVPHGVAPSSAPAAGHHGAGKAGHGKSGVAKTLPKRAKPLNVRDPFKPLVVAPSDTGGTQQGATTTVSAAPVAPSTAPTAPVVIPTSQPSTSTNTTPTSRPLWIRLVSINGTKSATFDVGYKHHKFHRFRVLAPAPGARQGTVFDKIFALIAIQGGSVSVQIGDSTPFDLTPGVAHSV